MYKLLVIFNIFKISNSCIIENSTSLVKSSYFCSAALIKKQSNAIKHGKLKIAYENDIMRSIFVIFLVWFSKIFDLIEALFLN